MKRTQVVAVKHTYFRIPWLTTAVWWLLMDRFDAPGWLWGATGVVIVVLWVGFVKRMFTEVPSEPAWKDSP